VGTLVLLVAFLYLVYKVWDIFGFWTILWTSFLGGFSTLVLTNLISSRSEAGGSVIYNPQEWPRYLNVAVSLGIGGYLFSLLKKTEISSYDYQFGLSYLLFLSVLPAVFSLYRLIRDRNDYIEISESSIRYKDNEETGDFPVTDITGVEVTATGIKLTFSTGTERTIRTPQMNFSTKDTLLAATEIKGRIPPANAQS
jgi:hypothetical protein